VSGPPAAASASTTSPGAAGHTGEVYEVRWASGGQVDPRRRVDERQAQLLVEGGVCDEVRSPTGILRYLKMRRSPSVKKFASIVAQGNFTITTTGNLHEHISSKAKGF
jgi:hypothetical protein